MTTLHALQRTYERTGFNIETSERFIHNAIRRGKPADAFCSREREYLQSKESKCGCWTAVYNTFCFIFNDVGDCITMYPLPKWFGKKLYDGKHEIRNVKKYMRNNNYYEQEDIEDWLRQVS